MKSTNNVAKGEGIGKEVQRLRGFGIVMICIAIINPIFLILGIIFLAKANDLSRRLEDKPYNEELYYEDKLFCPNCGTKILSEDCFCYSCGKILE